MTAPASRPSATPAANAISTTNTSGACHVSNVKKRSVTGSAFCSETNSSTMNTAEMTASAARS